VTRGRRPHVSIAEAQQEAMNQGCTVITLSASISLPFDFILSDHGRISLVRVRRLRYPRFEVADIAHFCREEIEALRRPQLPAEISRQLHVRGPGGHWHRYLVLPDSIRELEEP
jgi:hypothetical protein